MHAQGRLVNRHRRCMAVALYGSWMRTPRSSTCVMSFQKWVCCCADHDRSQARCSFFEFFKGSRESTAPVGMSTHLSPLLIRSYPQIGNIIFPSCLSLPHRQPSCPACSQQQRCGLLLVFVPSMQDALDAFNEVLTCNTKYRRKEQRVCSPFSTTIGVCVQFAGHLRSPENRKDYLQKRRTLSLSLTPVVLAGLKLCWPRLPERLLRPYREHQSGSSNHYNKLTISPPYAHQNSLATPHVSSG